MNVNDMLGKFGEKAKSIGFLNYGISKAGEIVGFSKILQDWLDNNYHADMLYMARNKEKRCDVTRLVEGAKSVISLVHSYYPEKVQAKGKPVFSKYAYGQDYHDVLKDKMQQLWDFLKNYYPNLQGRIFVDSAPVSDKLWAVQAGLGWLGKNSCLIHPDYGSFVFICELIVNIELPANEPFKSHFCGSCSKCIEACPTQAIVKPGVIDSNKCISYLTIENRNEISDALANAIGENIFGCDICQDVCPWNKKSVLHRESSFNLKAEIESYSYEDWNSIEQEDFSKIFKGSPVKRTKYAGFKRNFNVVSKNKKATQ
jgi:epoxyqueuosine reductase